MFLRSYKILDQDKARELAEKVKELDWQDGKARTKQLTGTVKRNQEILDDPSLKVIGKMIANHPEIQLDAIPKKIYPPKYSRYVPGDAYHKHTDSPWMGDIRTDLSCTLWLSDEFGGGSLCIDGQRYRCEPGHALIYQCGLPHEVLEVTEGERICVVTWIQSRIRDAHKRSLVGKFRRFLSKIENDHDKFVEGGQIHSELIRMWME